MVKVWLKQMLKTQEGKTGEGSVVKSAFCLSREAEFGY